MRNFCASVDITIKVQAYSSAVKHALCTYLPSPRKNAMCCKPKRDTPHNGRKSFLNYSYDKDLKPIIYKEL